MQVDKVSVLSAEFSNEVRARFTEAFIDVTSQYYRNRIARMLDFEDGLAYRGYLWDCLIAPRVINYQTAVSLVHGKDCTGYVMWDIHSTRYLRIPNYWKFPKASVVKIYLPDFRSVEHLFPEDVYIFDETLAWTCVLTHEYTEKNSRWCLRAERQSTKAATEKS